jgi:hypothetical protein
VKRLGPLAIVVGIISTLTVARPAAAYDTGTRLEVEDPGVASTPNERWEYAPNNGASKRDGCLTSMIQAGVYPTSSATAAKVHNIIFNLTTKEGGELALHGYRQKDKPQIGRARIDNGTWVALDYSSNMTADFEHGKRLVLFPSVSAGKHQMEVEATVNVNSGYQVALDFIEGKLEIPHTPGCGPSGTTVAGPGVQTPELDCYTEFPSPGKVTVRAKVGNPQSGAADTVKVGTSFAPEVVVAPGGRAEFTLPDLATKPSGGWTGTCRVVRSVNLTTYRTSSTWKNQPGGANEVWDLPPDQTRSRPWRMEAIKPDVITSGGQRWIYVPDGSTYRMDNSQRVPVRVDTPKVPVAPATPPGGGGGAGFSIPSAAAAGWLMGGKAAGIYGEITGWVGDDEWFCKWNPSYKAQREQYCTDISSGELDLRQQTQLREANGNVVDTTSANPWQTAEAIAESNIDPANPDKGSRNHTDTEMPSEATNPDRQASLKEVTSPQGGSDRAANQEGGQTTRPDTRGDGVQAAAPPPPPPGTGECALSIWGFLNPLNIAESIGCVLRRLFIPKASFWSTALGGITQLFPVNIINETIQVGDVVVDRTNLMLDQSACASFDYSNALGGDDQYLNVKLPTPTSYGCPQNVAGNTSESTIAELYGYRVMFRNLLRTLLYIGFGLQVVRAFQPGTNEMDPEDNKPGNGYSDNDFGSQRADGR